MKVRYCIHKPMLAGGDGYCREIRLLNIPELPDIDWGKEGTNKIIMDSIVEMWPGWDIEAYYLVMESH